MTKTARARAPMFKTPQPVSREGEQWIAAGAATKPSRAAPSSGRTARLTIELTPDLHWRFKMACLQRRTKMVDELTGFIERFIEDEQ